jgi:hypothetical protein
MTLRLASDGSRQTASSATWPHPMNTMARWETEVDQHCVRRGSPTRRGRRHFPGPGILPGRWTVEERTAQVLPTHEALVPA